MPAPGSHEQHDSVHLQDRSVVAAQGVSRDGGRPAEDEIPELESIEERVAIRVVLQRYVASVRKDPKDVVDLCHLAKGYGHAFSPFYV